MMPSMTGIIRFIHSHAPSPTLPLNCFRVYSLSLILDLTYDNDMAIQ